MTTKTNSIESYTYDDISAKEVIDFINSQSERKLNIIPQRDVRPQDVLPGKIFQSVWHSGNVRLKILISENFEKYENAAWFEKKEIQRVIVDTIRREGGRMLQVHTLGDRFGVNHECEMLWKEVRKKAAQKVVSNRFWAEKRRRLRNKRSKAIRDELSCLFEEEG